MGAGFIGSHENRARAKVTLIKYVIGRTGKFRYPERYSCSVTPRTTTDSLSHARFPQTDESTNEAIGDWHYWVSQDYLS
jgi:hypothetical protein